MSAIHFQATPYQLRGRLILRLPDEASKQLSSRGQVAVQAVSNGYEFVTVLEPDGEWGHWMNLTDEIIRQAALRADTAVTLTVTPTKQWPEPTIPDDVATALEQAPQKVIDKWHDITPMARWEWIRWIQATKNPATRAIRIEKTIAKLNGKHRRPCCFNLAACTDMELAKNGRLID